jgi:hypothetical protein
MSSRLRRTLSKSLGGRRESDEGGDRARRGCWLPVRGRARDRLDGGTASEGARLRALLEARLVEELWVTWGWGGDRLRSEGDRSSGARAMSRISLVRAAAAAGRDATDPLSAISTDSSRKRRSIDSQFSRVSPPHKQTASKTMLSSASRHDADSNASLRRPFMNVPSRKSNLRQ